MRATVHRHNRSQRWDATMTPMIDVVFLLLIFFVWTASFQVVEAVLPSELAAASGSGSAATVDPQWLDFDAVVVRMDWLQQTPSWWVNGTRQRSRAELGQTLAAVARIKSDLPVVIDPGPDVPLGHVIDAYDTSRRVGFAKVQFAAQP